MLAAFERTVAGRPDQLAVIDGATSMTYAQLDARASALAVRLAAAGAKRGELVGVVARRGLETIVAVLAAVKSGAAYLPIDEDSPPERVRAQLAFAQVSVVVRSSSQPSLEGDVPVVLSDVEAADLPGPTGELARPNPDDLFVVIFTSGSTGLPKGVAIEHRNVMALLNGAPEYLPHAGEAALQLCPPQFDVAMYELWGSLVAGATLVCHRPGRPEPSEVIDTVVGAGGAWAAMPTSAFHQVTETGPERLGGMRMVLAVGEVLRPDYVRRFRTECPDVRLVNIYGPAETTIFSSAHEVTDDPGADVPIGRPVVGEEFTLIDDDGAPVPPGERGELVIRGAGVARGYLNAPGLTAERFGSDQDGTRFYRTGDRVSADADGLFRIHGRADDQVKLRGYRVEPGEIEAHLRDHGGIADAAVVVRGHAPGPQSLVAFVVPAEGTSDDIDGWREHLAGRLPDYMIPAEFRTVAAFPRTITGKVDRKLLREVASERIAPAGDGDHSARAVEIARIYAQVLELDAVGPDEDFIALGGDSLRAVQALGLLREQLGVSLPLCSVFEAGTAAHLALAVDDELAPMPPVRPSAATVAATRSQAKALLTSELADESLPYQSQSAHRIVGPLDVPALERALSALVVRHEIFRATFPRVDGRWMVQVGEPWEVRLHLEDLGGSPDPEAALQHHLSRTFAQRIATDEEPPIRWSLVKVGDDEHVLVAVEHHVVHDGVTTEVVLRELAELYTAEVEGRAAALADLPYTFSDLALWQQVFADSQRGRDSIEHWRTTLEGAPIDTELPLDRPRPSRQTYRGRVLRRTLSDEFSERLQESARHCRVTPFAVMIGVHAAVLAQWGEADEVVIGSGFANRRAPGSESVVGMLVNTVALRLATGSARTVQDLVRHAHEVVLRAQEHQEVPFEQVVEALAPQRSGNSAPIYSTLFSFHDAAVRSLPFGKATFIPRDVQQNGSSKADVNVVVIRRRAAAVPGLDESTRSRLAEDGIRVLWEFNTDLFDAETAERMLSRYLDVLERAVEEPDAELVRLLAPSSAERSELLALAGGAAPYERDATLGDLFAEQAGQHPFDVAAVDAAGDPHIYTALESRANRLAHRFQAMGVGPGVRVGLLMGRSLELVIASLAVVKAGGAYVPLDLSDPRERLDELMTAIGASLVVTLSADRSRVPRSAVSVLVMDELDLSRESDDPPSSPVRATDAAYVMFTSGSTGAPKAVAVPHRAIVRLVRGTDYLQLGPGDRVLALAPPAFDAATFEVWGPLLNGGTLVLAPPGPLAPAEVADIVRRHEVTTLWLTAGLFRRVVDDRIDLLGNLRHLLAGGDVLSVDHVRKALSALGPDAVLINGYGPTEATTFTCAHRMSPKDEVDDPVPIGRPIANSFGYVLDARGELVPRGATGELWIGGDGVALGYVNDHELTADRFRPDPFSNGGRMYRSGDKVRWRNNGTLAFLGRADRQVKIRGFRIEPGEVEAALRGHPAVADAVVVPVGDSGDRHLAAFVVARLDTPLDQGELRGHASARLPAHAVPSRWALVDAIPLTRNGKVDVAQLPSPSAAAVSARGVEAAPADDLERRLVDVWQRVLGLSEVGAEDDFFALGGHSLMAVELFDAVELAFGRRLPLATIFEAPTVRRLAVALREDGWEAPRGVLVPVRKVDGPTDRPPLFLISAGDGNSAGFGQLARRLPAGQAVFALQQRGINGGAIVHRTIEQMAACYLRAIRTAQPAGPYLLGGRCLGGVVAYEVARRLRRSGETVVMVAIFDSLGPMWQERLIGGVPLDPVMLRSLRERGDRVEDVLDPVGGAEFVKWLADPVAHGDDGTPLSRYLMQVYAMYPALRDGFPNVAGPLAPQFVDWAQTTGVEQLGLEPSLMAPHRSSGSRPRVRQRVGLRQRGDRVRAALIEWADVITGERRTGAALRRRERIRRASLDAVNVYRAGPYDGVVTLIRSQEFRLNDRVDWWYGVDLAAVDERVVAGSHRSMLREPDVESLAACLDEVIVESLSGVKPAP